MPRTPVSQLIHEYFAAYERKNRSALEELLNHNFSFGSPHDPHLDRAAYFERCWPNSQNTAAFRIQKLFENDGEAFVLYDCESKGGATFSNTEYFRIEAGKVSEVRVFYGSLPIEHLSQQPKTKASDAPAQRAPDVDADTPQASTPKEGQTIEDVVVNGQEPSDAPSWRRDPA